MREFFNLGFRNAMEVAAFMVDKRRARCTIDPLSGDRYNVYFPKGQGHGEAAKAKLQLLRSVPIQSEA